jgi:hypothetical protein
MSDPKIEIVLADQRATKSRSRQRELLASVVIGATVAGGSGASGGGLV